MKINRLEPNSEYYLACRRSLEDLLEQPTDKQARPCPGCSVVCPACGSSDCTCSCSDACEHAPQQMSSEPTYPIEAGIVPLVYAFQCLGVCQPCWSCEGHNDPSSGELHKVPPHCCLCPYSPELKLSIGAWILRGRRGKGLVV